MRLLVTADEVKGTCSVPPMPSSPGVQAAAALGYSDACVALDGQLQRSTPLCGLSAATCARIAVCDRHVCKVTDRWSCA